MSRPFQIALVAAVLVLVAWFVALRPKSSTGGGTTSAPAASSSSPSSSGSSGPNAPGVAGLKRAIDKAHGAVAQSQANAKQLTDKSNAVDGSGDGGSAPAATPSSAAAQPSAGSAAKPASKSAASAHALPRGKGGPAVAARALARHRVLMILFYNPHGADDRAVRAAIRHVDRHHGKVVVLTAPLSKLAFYRAVTAKVSVTGSPTVVVFDRHGDPQTYVGYQEPAALNTHVADALAR